VRKLALKRIDGNRTITAAGPILWFTVPGVRFGWRSDDERDRMLEDLAQRVASLVGHRFEIRETSVPWSAHEWRQAMADTAIAPHPDRAPMLDSQERHLESMEFADKQVMIGVHLDAPNPITSRARDRIVNLLDKGQPDEFAIQADDIDRVMAAAGLGALPSTQAEVEWMIRRSIALGCPSPVPGNPVSGPWTETDIDELADTADWAVLEPFGQSVQVVAKLGDGRRVIRHVCILTLGNTDEFDKRGAWLSRCDQLPFPVEISATVDVLTEKTITKLVQDAINRVKYQIDHHHEHDEEPPLSLARAHDKAMLVSDEVEQGLNGMSTRVRTWVRFAVSGETEREALDRAGLLINLYKAAKVTVAHPKDQYKMAREFIAGEPLSSSAYMRQMPVLTFAGGMPQAHHNVGHRKGTYLGFTAIGARRPVLFDMHRSMVEREQSGTTLISGALGAGKSGLIFDLAFQSFMDGIPTAVFDPSGPLAELCYLPETRDNSRHDDLLSSRPGTLNPFRVLPDPARDEFGSQAAWDQAVAGVRARRKSLCRDAIVMFLPSEVITEDTRFAIVGAMKEMGGHTTDTPLQVIGNLEKSRDKHSKLLAEYLRQISHLPAAQLVFPFSPEVDDDGSRDNALLTVTTMRDLALAPEGKPRADWTEEQSMSAALLHLAAWRTYRSIYQLPRHIPKAIFCDECSQISRADSGMDFLVTTAAETRKRKIRAVFSAHSLASLYVPLLADKVDSVFVGRTTELGAQQAALRALGVPLAVGFEEILGGLSPHARGAVGRSGARQFVYRDGEDGCEKISVDLTHLPAHVRAALDTTPDVKRADVRAIA
jgi:AAA-like domain